jgi:hypothetical protein
MKSGWLRQEEGNRCAVLLRDWPAGDVVRVACSSCGRAERYRLAALIERFGPAANLPEVLFHVSRDCPRGGIGQLGDACGSYYPDLKRVRP